MAGLEDVRIGAECPGGLFRGAVGGIGVACWLVCSVQYLNDRMECLWSILEMKAQRKSTNSLNDRIESEIHQNQIIRSKSDKTTLTRTDQNRTIDLRYVMDPTRLNPPSLPTPTLPNARRISQPPTNNPEVDRSSNAECAVECVRSATEQTKHGPQTEGCRFWTSGPTDVLIGSVRCWAIPLADTRCVFMGLC